MKRALVVALLFVSTPGWAVGILRIDETKSISIAVGVKTSLLTTRIADFERYDALLENITVSLGGEYNKMIKLQINVGRDVVGNLRLLDGIGMFEPLAELKIWAGRLLVPTDRATLSGPYFSSSWDAPFAAGNPSIFAGRDDGLVLWGLAFANHLKYQGGVFRGRVGPSNPTGDPLFAGRLTVDVLDPEPSYYANGTYFGTKQILALGIGGRRQAHGAGDANASALFYEWNIDLLAEKRLGGAGVFTLEAAYFSYTTGKVFDATVPNGQGYYSVLAYLLPVDVGPGKAQIALRHQILAITSSTTATAPRNERQRFEATLNYFINGPFLRVGLNGWYDQAGNGNGFGAKLGAQIIL